MVGLRDPKTEHLRWCTEATQALDKILIESPAGVGSGNSRAAHTVSIGLRELCDALKRCMGRVRRRDQYRLQPRLLHRLRERLCLERRDIGDKQAVRPG